MTFRILTETVLAAVTVFLGTNWWQLHKREGFLRRALSKPLYLEGLISRDSLVNPPTRLQPYFQRNEIGYFINIDIVIKADLRSQHLPWVLISGILLLILIGSFYQGYVYFTINLTLLLLLGFAPLGEPAQSNADEHLLTMAVILYRWRSEDPAGCDEWVARAHSLKNLYRVVSGAGQ
jgi:hypothetical protein